MKKVIYLRMRHFKIIALFFVFLFVAKDTLAQEQNYRFHKVFSTVLQNILNGQMKKRRVILL